MELEYEKRLSERFGRAARDLARRLDGACVIRYQQRSGELLPVAIDHARPECRAWMRWLRQRSHTRFTDAFGARILQRGLPILIPAVSSATLRLWMDPAWAAYLDRYAVCTIMTVPLRSGRRLIGTVTTWREQPSAEFDERDLAFVEEAAVALADALRPVARSNRQVRRLSGHQ